MANVEFVKCEILFCADIGDKDWQMWAGGPADKPIESSGIG